MNVTLKIENDAELRAYIKDLIKGQVSSIIRDEFEEMIKEEISKKVKSYNGADLLYYIRATIEKTVDRFLNSMNIKKELNKEMITPIIEKKVVEAIEKTDWNKLVEKFATEKIKLLLK